MDDCFKSMFAYTDCIPQVCDELIKSIFPRALGASLMAELALTPAGDRGNSHGAALAGRHLPPPLAGTVLAFHGPQQKQR